MKRKVRVAKLSIGFRSAVVTNILGRAESRWWVSTRLLALFAIVVYLIAGFNPLPARTFASGNHDFIRTISKDIVPESGPVFSLGEVNSMVTGNDGSIYAGIGTTIFKLSSAGGYLTQWEANGNIGILNFDKVGNILYKTGDNGVQIFSTDGVEMATIPLNGSLLRGGGSSPKWYGIGTSAGPVTDLSSVVGDHLFVYQDDGTLLESYDLNSYSWPEGVPILSFSSFFQAGIVDVLYLGGPGRISSIRSNGIERQLWEDGTGTTVYDSIDADHRGNIYVSDDNGDIIRKFDKDMQPLMDWGGQGPGDLNFDNPGEITVSEDGNIYIDDVGNTSLKQYEDSLSVNITSPETIPGYIRPNTNFSYTVQTDNVSDVVSFSNIDGDGNPAALPDGLNLNPATGEIYGTLDPLTELSGFSYVFSIKVISSNGSYSEKYIALYGADLSEIIDIEADSLPDMQFGSTISYPNYPAIQINGGHENYYYPIELSIVGGELPAGVSLNLPSYSNQAIFSGNPSLSGSFTFTVRAESTDPLVPSFDEQEYTIEVLSPNEPVPFADDGIKIPIVEVESAAVRPNSTVISGSGPKDQDIILYVDGEELAVVRSDGDGEWSYEAMGLDGSGRSFSAGWEASEDIAFLLGSDNRYVYGNPLDSYYSSVQIFSTDSGKIIKELVMPRGYYATQVIPNSDASKLYISGMDIQNFGITQHNARVLEYDVASGSLKFVTDISEALNSMSSLLVSDDGTKLYVLIASGLYRIDTSNYETELVSTFELKGSSLARSMELSEDESKILIADLETNYGYGRGYSKRSIVVDLLSGISSIDEVFTAVEGNFSVGNYGGSFVARGNGNTYLAYLDGTVVVIDESNDVSSSRTFNLNHGEDHYYLEEDIVGAYFYDSNEDALYSLIVTIDRSGGPYSYEFTLRKLDIQSGVVSRIYQLPLWPTLGLLSSDGSSLYLFDGSTSPSYQLPFISGSYRLDLDSGDLTTLDEKTESVILPVSQGGEIVKGIWSMPKSRNLVSNFSVISPSIIGEVSEDEEVIADDFPEEEDDVVEQDEEVVTPDVISEDGSDEQDSNGQASIIKRSPPASSRDDVGIIRSLVNDLASALGVLPETIVKALPWAIILALFGLIAVVLLSLIKQLYIVFKMKKLVRRQELLNLEKSWLLSLSSHYLRTPLTVIQSGQEMLKDSAYRQKIVKGMSSLNITVKRVVDKLRSDSVVAEMQAPEPKRYKHASFWRPKVVVPVLATVGLVVLLNLIFTYGAGLYPGTVNLLGQFLAIILGAALLYIAYDTWAEKQELEKYQQQLLVYEEGLDKVRNRFVLSMANDLMPEIEKAKRSLSKKMPRDARKNINKGLRQLERTTDKFLLICQLEREELRKQAAELGLKGTVEKARKQSKHPDMPVKLLLSDKSTLSQPEVLLKKVFSSLIDNAAEHSNSKEPTKIYSDDGKIMKVSVEDFGKGIDKDKLSLLFKPLSKVEEDFTSQGMGLSLYLNRLIMHYLNGEIGATSKVGVGTIMTVEFPRELV